MYHYTYIIKHKYSSMKYIGSRTCVCLPKDDILYWSSSKHLPKNVSTTHKKRVLGAFSSRKEALRHEIYLHNKYNVAVNETFYNKAKQTTTAFSTEGIKLTEEHKLKCSRSLKGRIVTPETARKISESHKGVLKSNAHKKALSMAHKRRASEPGYVNTRQGIVMSDALKKKISEARVLGGKSKGSNNTKFTPWFIEVNGNREEFFSITKKDKSLLDGFKKEYYGGLCTKSKGVRPIKHGLFKGALIGNI